MRGRAAVLAGLALMAACGAPDRAATDHAAPEAAGGPTAAVDGAALTAEGWGPARIGMSLAEVEAARGEDWPDLAAAEGSACAAVSPPGSPGVRAFFEDGRLARISVQRPSALTVAGVGIGASDHAIHAAFPDAKVEPSKYVAAPAHDMIVFAAPDAQRGYRFEVGQDGLVHTIHAGGPAILWVEGCG